MHQVAIIIPTLNRIKFIERLIKYYYFFQNSNHHLYIGDASSIDNSKIINNLSLKFSNKKIFYFHLPGMNDRDTIYYLSKKIQNKFVAISGDDDFFIPDSLSLCANFLYKNLKFRTAQGKAILFESVNDNLYGKIANLYKYWGIKECNFKSSKERLINFSKNYYVNQFSVHRANEFINDCKFIIECKDRHFGELMHCFTSIARGKSKHIDCLYLVRQHSQIRGNSTISNSYKNKELWLNSPNWIQSFNIFKLNIEKLLCEVDAIDKKEANKITVKIIYNLFYKKKYKQKLSPNYLKYLLIDIIKQNKKIFNFVKIIKRLIFKQNYNKNKIIKKITKNNEHKLIIEKFFEFIQN